MDYPAISADKPIQSMTSTAELAIVMPIYNEAANIETVVAEWLQELNRLGVSFQLWAINDGSKDKTSDVLKELAVRYPGLVVPVDKKKRRAWARLPYRLRTRHPRRFNLDFPDRFRRPVRSAILRRFLGRPVKKPIAFSACARPGTTASRASLFPQLAVC